MKALTFSAIVALLFVTATALGGLLAGEGYGLPAKFSSTYKLEEFGLLVGVGRGIGSPVVYEWPVATLMRPGSTKVDVEVLNLNGVCPDGGSPVTIQVTSGDAMFKSDSTSLSAVLERESIFLILKIKITIKTNCAIDMSTPIVLVEIKATR